MPIIGLNNPTIASRLELSLVNSIRESRAVPIISDEAIFDLELGGWLPFVACYSDLIEYPLPDSTNLAKMTKFYQLRNVLGDKALKDHYLTCVKTHFYRQAEKQGAPKDRLAEAAEQADRRTASEVALLLGYARWENPETNPLLAVADQPFKVYLTTSPYTLLEQALQRAGKQPRTEFCRWTDSVSVLQIDSAIDDTYRPSIQEPLVFHLFGLDRYSDSLVLTQDDYLSYLVSICQGKGNEAIDRLPALVRAAFAQNLILLGFSLDSWPFRVLYAGLIAHHVAIKERGLCCLQLVPSEHEKKYLEDYLRKEAHFDVFWGGLDEYTAELRRVI
jgi:hypothetical protein